MSEADILEEQEELPNPYNMKKPWHKADGKRMAQADEMYYEDEALEPAQKATRSRKKSAPSEDSSTETNYKKRYDDLKRHYDSKLVEFRNREQELLSEAQAREPDYEAPKSVEDLAKFKEDYPDLYDTVETVAHQRAEQQLSGVHQKLSALEAREAQIVQREAEATLKERHPDFEDIRGSDDFKEWTEQQPEQIQDWILRNPDNVSLAVKALDLYKLESGKGQSSRQRRSNRRQPTTASAADMVSTKTTNVEPQQAKIWTETEIAKMSLDQFDKYEEDIRQAISEGRIRKE
jgi:hypothetical protein